MHLQQTTEVPDIYFVNFDTGRRFVIQIFYDNSMETNSGISFRECTYKIATNFQIVPLI